MIICWLIGPPGSLAHYYHSEGVCCPTDMAEDPVTGQTFAIHAQCKVDYEYTLRVAWLHTIKSEAAIQNSELATALPVWCKYCGGLVGDCIFCHSAAELISGLAKSQRGRALKALLEAWPSAPGPFYDIAGIPPITVSVELLETR